MKKHIWTIVASALLAAFTAYIALDTFVIPAVYDTDATEMNLALFDPSADAPASGAAQETSGETETGSSGPKDGSGSGRSSKRGSGFGKSRSSAGSGGAVS
ncbi:MAG: hypothetical protein IKX85_02890, partial [Clostridia bacterium]|nr:hypothetical protein [Clostridia bacterium]